MFIYSVGIIDNFYGLLPLLKEFVGQSLSECLWAKNGIPWEGDIRSDQIYIGGIPMSQTISDTLSCERFLVIKQDNNGSTFVASPIPFVHLEEDLIDSGKKSKIDAYPQEVIDILEIYF